MIMKKTLIKVIAMSVMRMTMMMAKVIVTLVHLPGHRYFDKPICTAMTSGEMDGL